MMVNGGLIDADLSATGDVVPKPTQRLLDTAN